MCEWAPVGGSSPSNAAILAAANVPTSGHSRKRANQESLEVKSRGHLPMGKPVNRDRCA